MSLTRISFYHFGTTSSRWWAFKQMRQAHAQLQNQEGLKFYKLMGSGAGKGFSIKPDWKVYAFIQVWQQESDIQAFEKSTWHKELILHSNGEWHFDLSPYKSKGTWNGLEPFAENEELASPLMAVITRASIKWTHLIPFWLAVPAVSRIIQKQKSLLFQKGIGEWPLIEQATFSIWEREGAMRDFAYRQKEHQNVVRKTRSLKWYREEQFTRFSVIRQYGDWPDKTFDAIQAN